MEDDLWILLISTEYTEESVLKRQYNSLMSRYGPTCEDGIPLSALAKRDSQVSMGRQRPAKDYYWSGKNLTMMVAWMASKTQTKSRRETYVKELKKYIKVDVYGKLGNFKCGKSNTMINSEEWKLDECTQKTNQYMFYLAFENSICRDYATEKFYRSLQQDVIPVVMGGADYDRIAPPNSYIDALQFRGPKELADYLKFLASNSQLYNRYFEWKTHYDIDLGHPYSPMICDVCRKLHQFKSKPPEKPTNLNIGQWIRNASCNWNWTQVLEQKFTAKVR
ncbi:unnamed protein product, partial [Meganyctiphanes norvegica]